MTGRLLRAALTAAFLCVAGVLAVVGTGFLLLPVEVRAHGWYTGTHDPETGVSCCGGTDCKEISDSDIRETAEGYLYIPTGELIPYARAQESKDWRFHRCEFLSDVASYGRTFKKGTTRCFFRRPGSS
jgi:hypothetical protein